MITVQFPMIDPKAATTLAKALAVMVLDPKIRSFLLANDPKALVQAAHALEAASPQWPALILEESIKDLVHISREIPGDLEG